VDLVLLHREVLELLHREDLEPAQVRKVDLDQAEVLTPKVGLDQVHLHQVHLHQVHLHQVHLHQVHLLQVQMEDSFTAQLWSDSQRALHLCVTVWTMTQLHRIAWMTPTAHEE
jgi:uncharacterized protein YjbI with pentapeptide repeats